MALYTVTINETCRASDTVLVPEPVEFVVTVRASGGSYTSQSAVFGNPVDLTDQGTVCYSCSSSGGTLSYGDLVTGVDSSRTAYVAAVGPSQILFYGVSTPFGQERVQKDGSNYVVLTGIPRRAKLIVEQYDDWATGLSDNPNISHYWTTDETHYIEVRPADGEEHPGYWVGTAGGGARLAGGYEIGTAYVRLVKLGLRPVGRNGITIAGATKVIVDRCVLNGNGTTGNDHHGIRVDTGTLGILDSAVYRFGGDGIRGDGAKHVTNCVIYGNGFIGVSMGNYVVNTCSAYNDVDFTWSGAEVQYNNASSDGTATGANSHTFETDSTLDFYNTAAGSEDFRIQASSVLYMAGNDGILDDPYDLGYSTLYSITGRMRPRGAHGRTLQGPCDIGADDHQVAYPVTVGPDLLIQSGNDKKFFLVNDVTSPGTAIVMQGSGICLNCEGHRVYFGTSRNICAGVFIGYGYYASTGYDWADDPEIQGWTTPTSDCTLYNGTVEVDPTATTRYLLCVAMRGTRTCLHDLTFIDHGDEITYLDRLGVRSKWLAAFTIRNCYYNITAGLTYIYVNPEMYEWSRQQMSSASMHSNVDSTTDILVRDNIIGSGPTGVLAIWPSGGGVPPTGYCLVENNVLEIDQEYDIYSNPTPLYIGHNGATVRNNSLVLTNGKGLTLVGDCSNCTIQGMPAHGGWDENTGRGGGTHYGCHGLSIRNSGVYGANLVENYDCVIDTRDLSHWAVGALMGGAEPGASVTINVRNSRFIVTGSSQLYTNCALAFIKSLNASSFRVFDHCYFSCDEHAVMYRETSYEQSEGPHVCYGARVKRSTFRYTGSGAGVFWYYHLQGAGSQSGTYLDDCMFDGYDVRAGQTYGSQSRTRAETENFVRYSFKVLVQDAGGNPLQGAQITLTESHQGTMGPYLTGADGRWIADGEGGHRDPFDAYVCYVNGTTFACEDRTSYSITVTHGGRAETRPITLTSPQVLTFTLGGEVIAESETARASDAWTITKIPYVQTDVTEEETARASDDWTVQTYRPRTIAETARVSDSWSIVRTLALDIDGTKHYVRVRIRDADGKVSQWSAYGQSVEGDNDFFIMSFVEALPLDGTKHYVRIRVKDANGRESQWSAYSQAVEDDNNWFIAVTRHDVTVAEIVRGSDGWVVKRAVYSPDIAETARASDAWTIKRLTPTTIDETAHASDSWEIQILSQLPIDETARASDTWQISLVRNLQVLEVLRASDVWKILKTAARFAETARVSDTWRIAWVPYIREAVSEGIEVSSPTHQAISVSGPVHRTISVTGHTH
ncbi:MAG: hypothetical protein JXB46_00985 [Candidatus Eisenbacteria bacterium]|nr:hypothetical protein [Candidatus Eisenbacteria bacterium]